MNWWSTLSYILWFTRSSGESYPCRTDRRENSCQNEMTDIPAFSRSELQRRQLTLPVPVSFFCSVQVKLHWEIWFCATSGSKMPATLTWVAVPKDIQVRCTLSLRLYSVWRPVSRNTLSSIFEMLHWLLGWFSSYCAAQLVTGTSERKHNKTSRPSRRHIVN